MPATPSPDRFSVVSFNIHKGMSPLNRRVILHELRDELHTLAPDLVFLQEVQDAHARRAARFADWPAAAQSRFLAAGLWHEVHYGRNAVYEHGHHGNAILSRFAVEAVSNQDMSMHRFERRGLLHAVARVGTRRLHCYCVHLALTERARARQVELIVHAVRERTAPDDAVIVAGDFNDWRNRAGRALAAAGLDDVFLAGAGKPPRTFPGRLPLLRLDRIYARGLKVAEARPLRHWPALSDHLALYAVFEPG